MRGRKGAINAPRRREWDSRVDPVKVDNAGSTRLRVGECGPRQGTEGLGSTRRTTLQNTAGGGSCRYDSRRIVGVSGRPGCKHGNRVDPPARGVKRFATSPATSGNWREKAPQRGGAKVSSATRSVYPAAAAVHKAVFNAGPPLRPRGLPQAASLVSVLAWDAKPSLLGCARPPMTYILYFL
jgi:hypothetical protein